MVLFWHIVLGPQKVYFDILAYSEKKKKKKKKKKEKFLFDDMMMNDEVNSVIQMRIQSPVKRLR